MNIQLQEQKKHPMEQKVTSDGTKNPQGKNLEDLYI